MTAHREVGALRLASAGIGVVGLSFGMARYGYGLLLPDMRADLGLSTSALGAIASSSYIAYLVASVAAGALPARLGPRRMVVLGGLLAVAGMVIVALAQGPAALAVGIMVAGASSGLVFPPFSDAVQAWVAPSARGRVFSAISSGTGYGVALAAPIAIAAGSDWRATWLIFAGVGVVATLWAARVLPAGTQRPHVDSVPLKWSWFACPRSGPLLAGAILVGLAASVFWTFAVDYLVNSGSLSTTAGRAFFVLVGLASILGGVTGDLTDRVGSRVVFVAMSLLLAGSLAVLAAGPGSLAVAGLAGILFGAAYNVILALQGLWSARVFADRPTTGLAAVMFALGFGLLLGPLLAGALADLVGLDTVFLLGAVVFGATGLLAPREEVVPAVARG